MNYYGYYGRLTAHDGKRGELLDILIKASNLLEENKDCLQYIVGVADKNDIWVSELWIDKAAHDSSLAPENIRTLIMTARPLISSMGDNVETIVYGGKGIPS